MDRREIIYQVISKMKDRRCEHGRRRCRCQICGGASICEHGRLKERCRHCNPAGHLKSICSNRVYKALTRSKEMPTSEYIGCTTDDLRSHIEQQFQIGMTWDNYGEWHIDHIVPVMAIHNGQPPDISVIAERLHYTNTQPLWARDNLSKGNRIV